MILTTTPSVEGRTISGYKGVVFGEVISGVNFIRDFAASIRNIVGGRSGAYEDELIKARTQAMNEMAERAAQMGANAVVGIDIDYEYFTNSKNNIAFYKKLGFEVFDYRTIEHDGKTMGSWSVKKKL